MRRGLAVGYFSGSRLGWGIGSDFPGFECGPGVWYPHSEEHESLTSHDGVATVLSSGILIDLNLNMSIPDTYRSPPAPIPYDVVLGRPQSTDTEEKPNYLKDENCRNQLDGRQRKVEIGPIKSSPLSVSATDDEDACPTCLEEYDADNPKIMTKCNHHFHMSCILEWMERSDTCPICDQSSESRKMGFFLAVDLRCARHFLLRHRVLTPMQKVQVG
ncbi:E3 ubiquitin-protein ligase at3g02290 [Phtheirospermum japonicum]|uniref:RING-type E3 ubiquitin transferase n=1 Tax=Phtheirospermum japonicum TaxID=374723 RepID=A0A830BXJ2_9LAMI|nr:E3 ubiquitin-protein ligase at3g02290 [Phtheirospermum japonicum]